MVVDGKSSQEYPVNTGVPQGFILGPTLFLIHISDLSDVICNTAVYANDTTHYSKYDQASDLWLELASELESELYVKEGLPFAQDLSLENSANSYLCF